MAARTGMANLINNLRSLTSAGSADYTVNGSTYWTDDQLQTELDRHTHRHYREYLEPEANYDGGTVAYTEYTFEYENAEEHTSGSARWRVENSIGNDVGTADYSVDYNQRRVTFGTNQGGTPYFLTYYTYDLYRAAAAVWTRKVAQVADRFDLKTDNHDLKRSQLTAHYRSMARDMLRLAKPRSGELEREDVNNH